MPVTRNTLFYGDNLPILGAHISDESADLILPVSLFKRAKKVKKEGE